MWKRINKFFVLVMGGFVLMGLLWASGSWDSERLELEMSMQKRIEEALSKILPTGQFVVVVKIEPWAQPIDSKGQPIEEDEGFYLPGVPARNKFDSTADQVKRLVDTVKPDSPLFRRFIRRISTTLVLDKDLDEEAINNIRELTRQMVGLDAQRGDTLDIQRQAFQKPTIIIDNSGMNWLQKELQKYWLVVSMSLLIVFVILFALFIFGPLRGFLARFVQILPTLRPPEPSRSARFLSEELPQMLPALLSQNMGMLPGGGGVNMGSPTFSGSLQVENPNKIVLPFGFIREDHLSNLSVLLSRETPERAAVVLGYLPPEWISRVLNHIEPNLQSDIAAHLATSKQLLPEQVEDIEQDLKRRLDYLIGGPERIIAIYETLDSEAQKRMIENLQEEKPELAEQIRRRALLFEDITNLDATDLKAVLRDIDLQTMISCLQGMPREFCDKILENISEGKAEIVREELDSNKGGVNRGTREAQRKVILIARRLLKEGQIRIPDVQTNFSTARFGSLKDVIKMPPGLDVDAESKSEASSSSTKTPEEDIEERIKRFMSRRSADQERFPNGALPADNDKKE